MKKSDIFFYLIIGSPVSFFVLLFYILSNIEFWLWDLKECSSVMEFDSFLINHIHIIFYITLLPIMLFLTVRAIIKSFVYINEYIYIKNLIEKRKIKDIKNIIIIDFEPLTAFNFGLLERKIVLSKTVLSLKEKKYIFMHEKAHFKEKDSLKIFIVSILSALFFKSEKIKKQFSLLKEIEADSKIKGNRVSYAEALVKFYTYKMGIDVPMANKYIESRIMYILGEKEFHTPKSLYLPLVLIFITFFSILFRTCFCGVM